MNQGKGGAVRTVYLSIITSWSKYSCFRELLASSGNAILMVDADGASEISEFEKLVKKV